MSWVGFHSNEDEVFEGVSFPEPFHSDDDDAVKNSSSSSEENGDDDDSDTESSSSGDEGDNEDNDPSGNNAIQVSQVNPVWTGEELVVVSSLKDRWFLGTSEEQQEVLEEGVKALMELEPQDPVRLKKKLGRWLRRRAGKRRSYGPGTRPSFQTVLAYYKEAEVTENVWVKHGVRPGGKNSPFLGLWKKELSLLQKTLKTDPDKKHEYDRLEAARQDWTTKGPPRERQKRMAEKKAPKLCMEFAARMYFELGLRCVISVGYRNTENRICFGSYDFNKSLGRGKKGFVNEHSAAVKPFNAAWNRYLSKNLTDDEDEENGAGDEDPLPVRSGKVSINKLDIVFKYNSRGEPLLPSSCLNLKLEEKKHLMRCFIKALYGIAKGVTYPGPGCIPPWAKINESPDSFFCPDSIPASVEMKEPSKMTVDPINKCLTSWLEKQSSGQPSFKFHHIWNEARGVFIVAEEPQTKDELMTEQTRDSKAPKRKRQMAKVQFSDQKSKEKKQNIRNGIPTQDKGKSRAHTPKKAEKKHTVPRRDKGKAPARTPIKDDDLEQDEEMALFDGSDIDHSYNGPVPLLSEPSTSKNVESFPVVGREPAQAHWPIDPSLQGYPTQGPNDPVPMGCKPVPVNYIPLRPTHHSGLTDDATPVNPMLDLVKQLVERIDNMEKAIHGRANHPVTPLPQPSSHPLSVNKPTSTVMPTPLIDSPQDRKVQAAESGATGNKSGKSAVLTPQIPHHPEPKPNMVNLQPANVDSLIKERPGTSASPGTEIVDGTVRTLSKARTIPEKDAEPSTVTLPLRKRLHQSAIAGPSRPRTWPKELTPCQTRQQAREKANDIPTTADVVAVKTESLENTSVGLALKTRKRKPTADPTSTTIGEKKVKTGDSINKVPKPRPLRKSARMVKVEDDSDTFNLRGRRITKKQ